MHNYLCSVSLVLFCICVRDVKFGFFKHLKFVCNYSNFIRSSKMSAAVLHCKSDSVNCCMAYHASDPHRLCRRSLGDNAQSPTPLLHHLITQQVAHAKPGGSHHPKEVGQWESAHLPTTTDASRKHPTIIRFKRPRTSHNDCITLCGATNVGQKHIMRDTLMRPQVERCRGGQGGQT